MTRRDAATSVICCFNNCRRDCPLYNHARMSCSCDGYSTAELIGIAHKEYARKSRDAKTGKDFYVLKGDDTHPNGVVTVSEELTKAEVNSITAENQPKLTFTAYAVQKDGITDAATAWTKANPTTNP